VTSANRSIIRQAKAPYKTRFSFKHFIVTKLTLKLLDFYTVAGSLRLLHRRFYAPYVAPTTDVYMYTKTWSDQCEQNGPSDLLNLSCFTTFHIKMWLLIRYYMGIECHVTDCFRSLRLFCSIQCSLGLKNRSNSSDHVLERPRYSLRPIDQLAIICIMVYINWCIS